MNHQTYWSLYVCMRHCPHKEKGMYLKIYCKLFVKQRFTHLDIVSAEKILQTSVIMASFRSSFLWWFDSLSNRLTSIKEGGSLAKTKYWTLEPYYEIVTEFLNVINYLFKQIRSNRYNNTLYKEWNKEKHFVFSMFIVDGHWSPWSRYGRCSKSCGGGSQHRTRTCNDPPPANGGARCRGPSKQARRCNSHPCKG